MVTLSAEDLFRQVRSRASDPESALWGDLDAAVADTITCLFEWMALSEVERRVGVRLRERGPARQDQRNGYRTRQVQTAYHTLRIRIPRLRSQGFVPSFLEPSRRAIKTTEAWIAKAFLAGVCRADLIRLMEAATGCRPSEGLLRRVQADLDLRTREWKQRLLHGRYVYLFLDAAWVKDIVGARAGRVCVLTAVGVTEEGVKEILGFERVQQEKESAWRGFLGRLLGRGLDPRLLRLVISDEHKGLLSAVAEVLGDVAHQLCWAHRSRNVWEASAKSDRKEMAASLRSIYQAEHLHAARDAVRRFEARWQGSCPALVATLKEDMRYLEAFFRCPKEHWRYIRTTNPIERTFRELRRRRFGCGAFASPIACDRVVGGVFMLLNDRWSIKTLFSALPPKQERENATH
jgi:putative transposase